jgi:hypothetical protein
VFKITNSNGNFIGLMIRTKLSDYSGGNLEKIFNTQDLQILFGDKVATYLGVEWELQIHELEVYMFAEKNEKMFRIRLYSLDNFYTGELRIKIDSENIYELWSLMKLSKLESEDLNFQKYVLTNQKFISRWKEMFPDNSYIDTVYGEYLNLFETLKIPKEYIENFLENQIQIDQIVFLKSIDLSVLIDKIGHRLKLEKYIEEKKLK